MGAHQRHDTVIPMWKDIARALGLAIPDQQLDAISPVLDRLWMDVRRALERDLSATDPAFAFRPDGGGEE